MICLLTPFVRNALPRAATMHRLVTTTTIYDLIALAPTAEQPKLGLALSNALAAHRL